MAASRRRIEPRTIDEVEAQAASVHYAEREAMRRLAELLRELASEPSGQSRLPIYLVKAAPNVDMFLDGEYIAKLRERSEAVLMAGGKLDWPPAIHELAQRWYAAALREPLGEGTGV